MATSKTKTSLKKSKVEAKLTDVAAGPTSPENGNTKPLMAGEESNPIVTEREPEADTEVETGKKAQELKGKESYTIPVKTKTTNTEFTIINH